MDLKETLLNKCIESNETKMRLVQEQHEKIISCAQDISDCLSRGGRLVTFGNGGSSCDAEHLSIEFSHPIFAKRKAFPSLCLSNNVGFITASGNDNDYSMTFVDQLKINSLENDILFGISTSGNSSNVFRALEWGRKNNLLTVGLTGGDGGRIIEVSDHCLMVPSFSIHRIQESHVFLLHVLWDAIHILRGEEDII